MNCLRLVLVAGAAAAALSAAAARAEDYTPQAAGTWVVDVRATDVAPQVSAPVTSGGHPTGLNAKVSDDVIPSLGIEYFATDHLAVDLTLGTSQHQISAQGTGLNADVHKTWVLPPVLTAQYHFNPKGRFSPYLGTGPNYMVFYSGQDQNGFKVKLKDGFGWAVQGGADYAIAGPWTLNVDVKKVFFTTKADIDNGALASTVRLDPWVVSAGVGYRF
jgi:outer membrane protein